MTWYSPLSIAPALIVALVAASPAAAKETSEKPAAAAAEPAADPAGYFRFDYDSYGLQLWVGATHQIGGVEIYTDV